MLYFYQARDNYVLQHINILVNNFSNVYAPSSPVSSETVSFTIKKLSHDVHDL